MLDAVEEILTMSISAFVNNDYENTNFLNLPKGFKLGG